MGKGCGAKFGRTSEKVNMPKSVMPETSNITILHYYIITKCLFLTIGYNNIFIYKYIIINNICIK